MDPIKNIEIKNFKSIRHQKIDGCKRINVFIGYPNVGKSNILEAIGLFGLNEGASIRDLVRIREIPTIFFNGFIEDEIMVLLNDNYAFFGNVSENIFSIQLQTRQGSGDFVRLNPALNGGVVRIYDFKDFFESRGIRGSDIVNDQYVVKKYDFRKDIKFDSGNYSSLQFPFGNNIFSVLRTNKKLNKEASELFNEYNLKLLFGTREQAYTILKETDSGRIFTVPYEMVADTLQRLIFFKAAIYSNKENILLFEEPEAHMFPPYTRKFTTDVIFDKTNQFFINTHSPYVLNSFMEEAPEDLSVYLVYYEEGETKVKLMNAKDMEEVRDYGVDLFYNLESYLKHGQVNNP